jgi:Aspartyl/Asparaginyl beta-hydroxylase
VTVYSKLKTEYKLKEIKSKTQSKVIKRPLTNHQFLTKVLDFWQLAPKHTWPNAPYYTGTGLHYSEKCGIIPKTLQVCGNHNNSALYNDTLLYNKPLAESLLENLSPFPTVRCKIGCLRADAAQKSDQKKSWHRDETPFEVLRVVIPITSNSAYRFQMDNEKDIWLEPGNFYAFDQSVYHRVFSNSPSNRDRIHLILSFVTWFDLQEDCWIPSKWFNQCHPMDLLDYINL